MYHNINNPLLSIIMPFYNNKELVGNMIDSIIANDFQDWELIAIDDGSSQDTLNYLEKYSIDKRIHIIKRDKLPKGAQTCRNIGINMMRGTFVVFFDSDDYITPDCLQKRVMTLQQRPDLDFMVFPSGTYKETTFNPYEQRNIYGYKLNRDDIASFACRELPFIVWNNIYRSNSIRKYNLLWDTNLLSLQDADFNMQAILAGLKYDYAMSTPDYGYRISYRQGNISNNICSEKHICSHIYATEKFYKSLHKIYGHKYDSKILQGLLFIYNHAFTNGINKNLALKMAKCVVIHNKLQGTFLKILIHTTCILEHFIPAKMARQLPMAPYLILRMWHEKRTSHNIESKYNIHINRQV